MAAIAYIAHFMPKLELVDYPIAGDNYETALMCIRDLVGKHIWELEMYKWSIINES